MHSDVDASPSPSRFMQEEFSTWLSPQSNRLSYPLDLFQSPNSQTSRTTTASQILASFSPKVYTKTHNLQPMSSPSSFPIAMEARRRTSRAKEPLHYTISSDEENRSIQDSSFSSPEKKPRKRRSVIDLEDEEPEEIDPPGTPPPRLSAAGHSLRQHTDLYLSLRAQENGDKLGGKKRKYRRRSTQTPKQKAQTADSSAHKTARSEIRDEIATETTARRARFFVAKKDFFLPLLPEGNFVQRLVDQHGDQDLGVPYEAIEKQPVGLVFARAD